MSSDRSYSDREVALVLRRAAEIESTDGRRASGVSRDEIVAIAGEAGIPEQAVERALVELTAEAGVAGSAFFPPASRRSARMAPAILDREQMARLVHRIEERVGRPGTVTEALDMVRWTAKSNFWTTQVTLSREDAGTRIGVHDRIKDSRIFYLLPGLWGGMIGFGITMSAGLAPLPVTAAVVGSAAAGSFIGRTVLDWLSRRSRNRVDRLAADLEVDARSLESGS